MLNRVPLDRDDRRPPVGDFGYPGAARWVAFYWHPGTGNPGALAWRDSRGGALVGGLNEVAFLEWPGRELWPAGAFGELGDVPRAAILWDRSTGSVSIGPACLVFRFLNRVFHAYQSGKGEQC